MDIKKFIYGHCVSPQKVRIWDTYSMSYVVREVPCGKCLHCKNTHVNEWVTRLYAQAQYSAHVYYITLDYAPFSYSPDTFPNSTSERLAAETAACWNNLNITHRYGVQPLILNKSHLQEFFKRFRKNNKDTKIQYFACGEYGMHAEGHGYGRPHFHAIIFSNNDIPQSAFESAWTVDGYRIGSVKYEDITFEAKCSIKNISINQINNAKNCFKYVAKYLQKGDFDFNRLATIDFHRTYFKSLQYVYTKTDTLFPELVPISDQRTIDQNWLQYCANYSPFVVCSRRPSIGLAYLQDNLQRFKESDFRLFGLQEKGLAFPRYFLRKTKEAFCRFVAVGQVSYKPSTSSRIGYVLSVLRRIYDDRLDFDHFDPSSPKYWYTSNSFKGYLKPFDGCETHISFNSLHIYDNKNAEFYQFIGYGYNVWRKVKKLGYVFVQYMDILDVINKVSPEFGFYYDKYVKPMHNLQVLNESELNDTIKVLYKGDPSLFYSEVYARYKMELDSLYKRNLQKQNYLNQF